MANALRLVCFVALAAMLNTPLAFAQSARSSHPAERGAAAPATPAVVNYTRGGAQTFTSRSAFVAACPGLPTEDYEEARVPTGGSDVIASPLNSSSSNQVFLAGEILPGMSLSTTTVSGVSDDLFVSGTGFGGAPSKQVGNNRNTDDVIYTFSPAVDCAGLDFDLNNLGTATTVTAYDAGGNVIGSATSAGGFAVQFIGFESQSAPVAKIVFSSSLSVEWLDTDNVTFGDLAGGCDLSFNAADLSYSAGTRTLTVAVTVHNGGGSPHGAQLALDYNRNGGNPQGTKTLGTGTLPAGATVSRTLNVHVPGAAPAGNYNFTLRLIDTGSGADCDSYSETIAISSPRVGTSGSAFEVDRVVDLTPEASAVAGGSAVSPNPFARQTQISYEVAATADVRLAVYDVLGREVAVLVDGRQEAGAHTAVFDARGLAAGTYVYRLVVGNDVQTGRMTLAF